MAKSDESGEGSFATVRVPLAGELGSLEGQLLNAVFRDANSRRKGAGLANFMVMQGWLAMIHDTDARSRAKMFRALDLPAEVIAQIEELWPNPNQSGGEVPAPTARPAAGAERPSPSRAARGGAAESKAEPAEVPAKPLMTAPVSSPLSGGGMMV